MEWFESFRWGLNLTLEWLSNILWGMPMIVLFIGTHIYMTVRTGFIQGRIGTALRLSIASVKKGGGDISPFGSLMVSMASTIGTGNIIGVGTAVALGGIGAVFWCWMTGILGIATKYAESLLAVKYRVKTESGEMLGGAMIVLDKVLHKRGWALFFCIVTTIASFGIGNMAQSNAAATLLQEHLDISPVLSGGVMAVVTGIVLIGGVKWLSQVCKVFVPVMGLVYIVGCLTLLAMNSEYVWPALQEIVAAAFSVEAVGGGVAGGGILLAMRYGIARGLFSNESGMGSAPIIASAAQTPNAVRQAMIAATATFWDTVVICALTGLVIASSVLAYPDISCADGGKLVSMAFGKISPFGSVILSIAVLSFVFSTLLGWSYYAERCLEYMYGYKIILPYRIIWVLLVFVGAVARLHVIWNFADCANGLMAIPNMLALWILGGSVSYETRKYLHGNQLELEDPTMVQ